MNIWMKLDHNFHQIFEGVEMKISLEFRLIFEGVKNYTPENEDDNGKSTI